MVSPSANVAFIDVSGDSAWSANTLATLDALNLMYVPLTSTEAQAINGWSASEFPEMVLVANKWVLAGGDKGRVSQYLKSGGHLFITGGEIAYGLADPSSTSRDINFLSSTLHATYVKDSAGPHTVHGVAGDSVSGGLTSDINIYANNVDNPNQPDQIKPANGSLPIFYYGSGTSQCGGIRWDSGSTKLVYLAFGLQNLGDADRASITTAILNWFQSSSSAVADVSGYDFSLAPNYPNPFSSSTWITYELAQPGPVRISVIDERGNEVAVIANDIETAGPHAINFVANGLPKGAYFAILRNSEGSKIRAMTLE